MPKPTEKTQPEFVPRFWRDDRLPFIEARYLADGRRVSYDRHAHKLFSIGAVIAGESSFIHGEDEYRVAAGSVVIINPDCVHACNPLEDLPWAYCMLYVDADWLADLQGTSGQAFQGYATAVSTDPVLFEGLLELYQVLIAEEAELLHKQGSAIQYFSEVQKRLQVAAPELPLENGKLKLAADFMDAHCVQDLSLDDISAQAGLSASYLFRAFKKQYGMTPHAYLINRRVQYAQERLKNGATIAEAALDAGFADQAHFQRVFKRMLAATPGQYLG